MNRRDYRACEVVSGLQCESERALLLLRPDLPLGDQAGLIGCARVPSFAMGFQVQKTLSAAGLQVRPWLPEHLHAVARDFPAPR